MDRRDFFRKAAGKAAKVVVEEAEAPVGVGSEVIAIINEECFWIFDQSP